MAQPQSAGAGHAAGPGDRTIVRGTVGPGGARLSYLAAEGGAGGETILLIHGAGVSARSWIHQIEGLSGTLRVLALDLPGRRESAPIREPSVASKRGRELFLLVRTRYFGTPPGTETSTTTM